MFRSHIPFGLSYWLESSSKARACSEWGDGSGLWIWRGDRPLGGTLGATFHTMSPSSLLLTTQQTHLAGDWRWCILLLLTDTQLGIGWRDTKYWVLSTMEREPRTPSLRLMCLSAEPHSQPWASSLLELTTKWTLKFSFQISCKPSRLYSCFVAQISLTQDWAGVCRSYGLWKVLAGARNLTVWKSYSFYLKN